MKIEIKSKDTGKDIIFHMKDVTMPLREQFVDAYMYAESNDPQKFSTWVDCIRVITTLTDDELLLLTDLDIVQIAVECMLIVNNKNKIKK